MYFRNVLTGLLHRRHVQLHRVTRHFGEAKERGEGELGMENGKQDNVGRSGSQPRSPKVMRNAREREKAFALVRLN